MPISSSCSLVNHRDFWVMFLAGELQLQMVVMQSSGCHSHTLNPKPFLLLQVFWASLRIFQSLARIIQETELLLKSC